MKIIIKNEKVYIHPSVTHYPNMTIDQNFPKYGMHRNFPGQLWEAEVWQMIGKEIPDNGHIDI